MTSGELRVDHESVDLVVRELADLKTALVAVVAYVREEDLTPSSFGVLGEQMAAGAAFVQVRDALVASMEKALPLLADLSDSVEESALRVRAVDEESAALITRAGEMR
ncbi:hypothetical protein [Actinokineospora xionganensis]|uniref:Excreted virulence factor EspC (Type VII ESX diderm) n=1 Tax=Actinokineospora xionganensis TaxID=2684470 RepID=A0ABR7L0T6_9PSEU|nr:hypothetical protein [Actinokineospora xionganensis]MBC6446312.1 hypothetical protein [Actinokineospora xionganensis]